MRGKKSPAPSNYMIGEKDNLRITENELLPQTDIELAQRARHGDMDAFHGLVDRHGLYLYGLAASLLGNADDAEDAVQETLAGAFRGLRAFRGQSSVKTWLTGILVRQAARHFRRGRLRTGSLQLAPEPAEAHAAPKADVRLDVQAAIMALRPDHREVIVLREMHGLSYEEIAQALQVPPGTVESRLFRARRELQELLRDYLP